MSEQHAVRWVIETCVQTRPTELWVALNDGEEGSDYSFPTETQARTVMMAFPHQRQLRLRVRERRDA